MQPGHLHSCSHRSRRLHPRYLRWARGVGLEDGRVFCLISCVYGPVNKGGSTLSEDPDGILFQSDTACLVMHDCHCNTPVFLFSALVSHALASKRPVVITYSASCASHLQSWHLSIRLFPCCLPDIALLFDLLRDVHHLAGCPVALNKASSLTEYIIQTTTKTPSTEQGEARRRPDIKIECQDMMTQQGFRLHPKLRRNFLILPAHYSRL